MSYGASHRHFGERTVLRDLSLQVPGGATLAVLGPQRRGQVDAAADPRDAAAPTRGRGARVRASRCRGGGSRSAGALGLLAHDPLLYRDLSGRENLGYHARLHGVGAERVEELLEAVGMERRADEPVRLLSRGMVQRLAVCRAVLHAPELLLLDEPLANLDPAADRAR